MFQAIKVADTASANRFIDIWTARYAPDLSALSLPAGYFPIAQIIDAASTAERGKTADAVKRSLRFSCELAGFRTYALFAEHTSNLVDAKRSAKAVEQVYLKALEVYRSQSPPSSFLKFIDSEHLFTKLGIPELMLPPADRLVAEFEPVFVALQQQHQAAQDPRAIGFLTTHFAFSTGKVLQPLSLYEQVLLAPYFKFIEEQICMPWQRVCAAVAHYSIDSLRFRLVEQLFAMVDEIAHLVYHQAVQIYPHHRSRRGLITDVEVKASILRDLNMMQGYLCLCMLEESMTSIEQELLLLCKTVLPSIEVKWTLVELTLRLLIEEIQVRLDIEQMQLFLPYTHALQDLFAG